MYKISVLTTDGWRFLKPTSGSHYTFDSHEKAINIAKLCYPDAWREQLLGGQRTVRIVRIVDDTEPANDQ